ncbi:hypothetical protein B0H34DRAFT_721660 [Crassisporium funariophilum]|nr:hypothetical protein B0H34DRAFT_721660 [Crassisporium funariophilum]
MLGSAAAFLPPIQILIITLIHLVPERLELPPQSSSEGVRDPQCPKHRLKIISFTARLHPSLDIKHYWASADLGDYFCQQGQLQESTLPITESGTIAYDTLGSADVDLLRSATTYTIRRVSILRWRRD